MGAYFLDHEVARYRAEGCVFPVAMFSPTEAADHRRRLEAAEAEHGNMHYRVKPYLVLSTANTIARHPVLLDAVEDVLGPDILLWDSAYVIKEARDTHFVSWLRT